jgi:hypothetical protein
VSIVGSVKITLHTLKAVDLLGIHVLGEVVIVVIGEHEGSLVCDRDHCCWMWLELKRRAEAPAQLCVLNDVVYGQTQGLVDRV